MEIKLKLEKQPCNGKSICEGCVLRVDIFFCANRDLCPNTKEENVNWKIATRAEKIDDGQHNG